MERFKKIYSQGTIHVVEIWVDTETGINYVFHKDGYAGGFTPLISQSYPPKGSWLSGLWQPSQ